MENTLYITCIRFSLQLLISESVFLIGKSRRDHFKKRVMAGVIVYFVLSSSFYYLLHQIPGSISVVEILFYIGMFAFSMYSINMAFDLTPLEILFAGIGGYTTEHIAYCGGKIIQYVTGAYAENIGEVLENLIFRFAIYVIFAVSMYFLVIRRNEGKGEVKEHDSRILVLSLIVLIVAIVLSVVTNAQMRTMGKNNLNSIICPIYGLICCSLVIMLEFYVSLGNRLNRENRTMEELLQLASVQQKSSKEAIDIINMKCHDLKHQMKALMTIKDAEERSRYIEEMRKAVSIYDATFHTDCEALDYVLREKMLLCEEYHISFSCMTDGKEIAFMHVADIYAMMGNALDNAIESVLKETEEKRLISLHLSSYGEMVHIHVENTCTGKIIFKNGFPITDKEDKNLHGFGVRSISYIARKYNGEVMMRQKENKFCLDILFPEQK